ncbi:MAG: tRNA glutamyl-Q(34) synthetase GluQRS [Pseudomonadales bacterium]|nr:tRNA glutamyl-Q(34) synthetase GluQRS [Pseudomonadales bacterium]
MVHSGTTRYIGRFAPSPTGPLHYGSLVSAVASFLDAKHNQGLWLLRIEDLDPPRESEKAPSEIMRQLEAYSLEWDGEVLHQSTRLDDYREALSSIREHTFACTCTRKSTPTVYPGTCRDKAVQETKDQPVAIRLRVPDEALEFEDLVCGTLSWSLEQEVGDFIIRRKDGLFAYQLAVVVDDIYQNITHIVRGRDLLDSTPRQLALYRTLGHDIPTYAHLPIVVDRHQVKLSKQAHARAIPTKDPLSILKIVLSQLGQQVPHADTVSDLLKAAIQNWDIHAVTGEPALPEPTGIHAAT